MKKIKHIICFSGGHASAITAIAAADKYGKENIILLNHDINENVEHKDIKRFKNQIAQYLDIPITYANMPDFDKYDQFDVCIKARAFKTINIPGVCTNRLKTDPFAKWLKKNNISDKNSIIYYGFNADEWHRIIRRRRILKESFGLDACFPLAEWDLKIKNTEEIGITAPLTYSQFKHANCTGCIKGGMQHWYVVYCLRPDLFDKAEYAEKIIKHSIIKIDYLHNLRDKFKQMNELGIYPEEKTNPQKFWNDAKKSIKDIEIAENKPCECAC